MPTKTRVIRDPLYGYISLPAPLAVAVDHPLFQRLRRIGQTSLTSAVYPTATGSRFEHGLGAMHLAMRGFQAAWRNVRDGDVRSAFLGRVHAEEELRLPRRLSGDPDALTELLTTAVGGAALLHDVGHPPFSHVLEPLYETLAADHLGGDPELMAAWEDHGGGYHEFVGLLLAEQILRDVRPDSLARLILTILRADENAGTWAGVLHAVVAGEVDVDRLDYVMRDAHKAGTEFGAIDYVRLIDALELHQGVDGFRIAPGVRARSAVETLLLQRTQAYKWIIYHPRVVGSNRALSQAVATLRELSHTEATFGAGPGRAPACDVFTAIWPPLNYIRPAEGDVKQRLPLIKAVSGEPAGQLTLADQQIAALAETLRPDLQASIDDTVVIEALKTAGLAAEALLAVGAPDADLHDQLVAFVTYQQHALYRRKNCLAAWKTVEEFDNAARDMRADLIVAVRDAYEEMLVWGRVAAEPAAAATLEGDRDDLLRLIQDDPVIGANRVITLLFDDEPDHLQRLALALAGVRGSLEGLAGRWEFAYTGFTSVKQGDEAAVLFDGEEELRLFDFSKLAQALASVEESRFRLCAFYFVNHPGRLPISEDIDAHELREKLTGDFLSAFPTFVRQTLPAVLRDSLSHDA